MNTEVLKQFVFDSAVELLHRNEGLTNEEIANNLLWAISKHDEDFGEDR